MATEGFGHGAARTGDRASVEQLVHDHLPLAGYAVAEVAARLPRHVSREELRSAALLGLAQAARTFDPARGLTFDKYAKTRIRGALLDELRSRDWASRGVRATARQVSAAADRLTARLGRAPTRAELAGATGLDVAALDRLDADLDRATVLSLEPLPPDGVGGLARPEEHPDRALLARERLGYLRDAVLELPDRLRTVVVGYFFAERQMQELAGELGVTESRVSQMCAEALTLLREGMNTHLDPELVVPEARPDGRSAKRKAAYYDAVGRRSEPLARLDAVSA